MRRDFGHVAAGTGLGVQEQHPQINSGGGRLPPHDQALPATDRVHGPETHLLITHLVRAKRGVSYYQHVTRKHSGSISTHYCYSQDVPMLKFPQSIQR